jgi:hypothetical protein
VTFKKGDRVKVRKLSEKEFKKIYKFVSYLLYLDINSEYFNKVYIIKKIHSRLIDIGKRYCFYPEELIKIHSLKNKLQLIKELIK